MVRPGQDSEGTSMAAVADEFAPSPEQVALLESVRELLAKECTLDLARRHDETGTFPHGLYRRIAGLGWLGLPFGAAFGGMTGDEVDEALVVEQLGYSMLPLAACYLVTVLVCGKMIRDAGSDEQCRWWLPRIASGEAYVSCGLTESSGDSGSALVAARAERAGEGWLINGREVLCPAADMARAILLVARTGAQRPGSSGLSVFLFDPAAPGVTITPLAALGSRPYRTCAVSLDHLELPAEALLGEENNAWPYLISALNRQRIAEAAMCTGAAQSALDAAIEYAKGPGRFGVPSAESQAVRHRLADAHVRVHQARLLTYRAAWLEANGRPSVRAASMAKVWASEAAIGVAGEGMRVLGGRGSLLDHPMQRYLRDSLSSPVGAGTNEIQRDIIAKELKL
jgi:alkylation response protein AidB-like acyl-CoA dehydrogenase